MACPKANVKFQLRRATAFEWANTNRTLLDGEPGYDTTNNILKIGRNNLAWNSLTAVNNSGGAIPTDLLYQVPTVTTITADNTNLPNYISVTWTYPAQEQTAIFQEPLPLILALNIELAYSGGTRAILTNSTASPFVYKSSSPTTSPVTTIKLFPITGTSRVVGTVYEYYSNTLSTLTGTLSVKVWYSNYSDSAPVKSSVNISTFIIPFGPPTAIQNLAVTQPNDSSSELIIDFDAPLYANSSFTTDTSTTIQSYLITITNPDVPAQNKTRQSLGLVTRYTEPVGYSDTTYTYTIFARNNRSYESSVSGSIDIPLPPKFQSSLTVSSLESTNEYFSNVTRCINSDDGRSKTVSVGANNIIKKFDNLVVLGSFAVGDIYLSWPSGTISTDTLTYTSTSAAGTRNITAGGTNIGTIESPTAASDFYSPSRPDRMGKTGYAMRNNTITINLDNIDSLKTINSSDEQTIRFNTERGSTPFDFYVSNITELSTAPVLINKTLAYTPTFRNISGFKVCNTTQLTVEASANVSTLGKYFFPNDWVARFNILGTSYTYDISKFYTKSTDTVWFITVPSPPTSALPTVINPSSTVSAITEDLYYGPLTATVDMKNLNASRTSQSLSVILTGSSPFNGSNIFIDNNSYNFVQSNRITLQPPVTPPNTVVGNLTAYNDSLNIVSTGNIMIYNGKYTLAGALPSGVASVLSLANNSRYATFGFVVPVGNYSGKALRITLTGIDSPANFNAFTSEITSSATRFNIYYRFETQYSSTIPPVDYRIPTNTYTLPDDDSSINYTTGWISANSPLGQDISTANYNSDIRTTIFNGLISSTISGTSVIFTVFQPNIYLIATSPELRLYVTIGGISTSRLRFTNCNYAFV